MEVIKLDFQKITDILTEQIQGWVEGAIATVPNLIVAVVILIVFFILSLLADRVSRKILPSATDSVAVIGIVTSTLRVLILTLGFFIALGVLNLNKTVTSLLAGAGVVGIALGFAFQDIASNFVSGVMIAFRQPYRVGDVVEVNAFKGTVAKINLRATLITTFDGLTVFVPNKTMFTEPLTNYTLTVERRLEIPVGVSYGDDLEVVEQLVIEACEDTPGRIKDKDIEVYFTEFGDSSINLVVFIWIEYPGKSNFLRARHHAIQAIKQAFDDNNITIPFPIRTMDFGIKGGDPLSAQLAQSGADPAQQHKQENDGSSDIETDSETNSETDSETDSERKDGTNGTGEK